MQVSAPAAYSRTQKALHWIVALIIALQFLAFDEMGRPFNEGLRSGAMPYDATTLSHIVLGVAVLAFAAWRLAIRARRGAPEAPASEPPLFRLASKLAHGALYAVLIALPLTGLVAWFGGIHDLGDVHEIGSNLLLALVGLHVAAVLVHQFWWKTGIARRMI